MVNRIRITRGNVHINPDTFVTELGQALATANYEAVGSVDWWRDPVNTLLANQIALDWPENIPESLLDQVITAHNPAIYTTDQQNQLKQINAQAQVAAIPNWSTWTVADWTSWFNSNIQAGLNTLPADIDNLTAAQYNNNARAIAGVMQDVLNAMATAVKNMGLMEIAIRNKEWPSL